MSKRHSLVSGEAVRTDEEVFTMKDRKGVLLVMGVFLILIFFGVFSYLYETGRITIAKMKAQNAADAAAAAGQVVYSNMRNNASTHYALMDIYDKMAKNAAVWQYGKFMLALKTAYHKRDWMVRNDEKKIVKDEWKAYHHAFHVQDACVTRYMAAFESKAVDFRDIYNKKQLRDYTEKFAKEVVDYNIFHVVDNDEVSQFPALWLRLWNYLPETPLNPWHYYPFVAPLSGLDLKHDHLPDYSSGSSSYLPVNYEAELGLDKLGRYMGRVRIRLMPTPFERFLNMNWLRHWHWWLPNRQVYATAAAQPETFDKNKIYIYNVTHLPQLMFPFPFAFREKNIYFGMTFSPSWSFSFLPASHEFNWYRPQIAPVMQSQTNKPHH